MGGQYVRLLGREGVGVPQCHATLNWSIFLPRPFLPISGPFGWRCMEFLDFREPVSAWSHCVGWCWRCPVPCSSGGAASATREAAEPARLRPEPGLLLFGQYPLSWRPTARRPIAAFARLDGVGIFALIAGSYTPMAWCLMRGRWRRWTLAVVWGVAATATVLIAAGRHFSPAVVHLCVPGDGVGRRRLLRRDRAGRVAPRLAARRRRWPVLQRGGSAQPDALACPLAGGLRAP